MTESHEQRRASESTEPPASDKPDGGPPLRTRGDRWHPQASSFGKWTVENPIAALTLAGLALYGVLRFSAAMFYGPLGFSPEDVGLDYAETLAASLYGLGLFVLTRIIVHWLWPIAGAVVGHGWMLARRKRDRSFRERLRSGMPKRGWFTDEIILNTIPVTLLVFGVTLSCSAGRAAVDGEPTGYSPLSFTWRAEPARVYFESSDTLVGGLSSGQCVLFLGEADGRYAIYDPASKSALRLPISSVTVETRGLLREVRDVPEECP